MLTKPIIFLIYTYLVIYKISTLFLKTSGLIQIKPINFRTIIVRIFKKYLKGSFVPICFQHLSLTNLAFLPCLCHQFILVKETFLCIYIHSIYYFLIY